MDWSYPTQEGQDFHSCTVFQKLSPKLSGFSSNFTPRLIFPRRWTTKLKWRKSVIVVHRIICQLFFTAYDRSRPLRSQPSLYPGGENLNRLKIELIFCVVVMLWSPNNGQRTYCTKRKNCRGVLKRKCGLKDTTSALLTTLDVILVSQGAGPAVSQLLSSWALQHCLIHSREQAINNLSNSQSLLPLGDLLSLNTLSLWNFSWKFCQQGSRLKILLLDLGE